ncbi:type I polyketide synthase [Dinghuibacter silviterrae]|uniref:Acyl transferase domain-containing protein n=1 Tax=Dinghuibacter silviterrae TaxID=1539049 RepID=A0A4R8DNH9_9BACT|nr:type I polyketide synthase [Dinghuibacter silviterrae]TDW99257.1 acyl transferase domain-containing protein [Dinghuibacter silviterrae]
MQKPLEIAIVGMSGIFPGAGDVHTFWRNILDKRDAIQTAPEHRLDHSFFDDAGPAADRFYCRKGGFIDSFATFDPLAFGLLPLAVEGTEPEQLLALRLAQQALADASVFDKRLPLDKTAVILGKGNYMSPGATRVADIVRTGEQIVHLLRQLLPEAREQEIQEIKRDFQSKKGRFGPDVAMGLVPNLAASLVANRLDLGGSAYTVDAACASSLVAVDHAVRELSAGRSDMVIAGGIHAGQNAPFWSIFTQLGALSRRQQIRPFDQRADGLLIGEGCGFVVLKRLEDALAGGHRIYAVIRGVGVSSDGAGTSVMSPSVKGQSKAMEQAWQQAQMAVRDIGYIEAHGTGTPLGDKTELETLARVFGNDNALPRAGIGSVKSMIGHAMPAAGIAGLIKTALALYHEKIPPTLHCEEPLEQLRQTRFEPVRETLDWRQTDLPLVAGVNAFGFGGINAHVVLQGAPGASTGRRRPRVTNSGMDSVRLLARATGDALIEALENGETDPGEGPCRLALFDPTEERIRKAINIIRRGTPWRNKQDIWFTTTPLVSSGGKVAFLFPGLDGLGAGETESVASYFGIEPARYGVSSETELFQVAFQAIERSETLDTALKRLGISPDLNAGHSLGEFLAARSSSLASPEAVARMLGGLNPALFDIEDAGFLVAGCGYPVVAPLLLAVEEVYLSIDNCPQQVILCGRKAALERVEDQLKAQQVFVQRLPFQSGFHSPFIEDRLEGLMQVLSQVPFQKAAIPLWSATTVAPYPDDAEGVRQLTVAHLLQPVRFRELIDRLYEEGTRVFIQVGSGGLTGFVDDTLKQRSYSAVAANVPHRSGLCQLQRVLAALFVEGRAVDYAFMGVPVRPAGVSLQLGSPAVKEIAGLEKWRRAAGAASVASGPVGPSGPAAMATAGAAAGPTGYASSSPLMQSFLENCQELTEAQTHILDLLAPRRPNFTHALDISLENTPYLIDHSLIRQRPGWPHPDDREPVIPMTMALELFWDIAAEKGAPGKVRRLQQVAVFQWMNVAAPFRERVTGSWKGRDVLEMTLENYARAEVVLAATYPQTPDVHFDIGEVLDIRITPAEIYSRMMFHGPAYQGIREVVSVGKDGIRGWIQGGAGKGSLLDNAGQLFGLWLQLTLPKDNVAFPVKINEVEFFGDPGDQDGLFECTCRLIQLQDEFATGDILLKRNGKTWCVLRGWQNRRLDVDERLWRVCMDPLHHALSVEVAPGVWWFHHTYQRIATWNFILKRYLSGKERSYRETLSLPRQKEWAIGRIAVKDALRGLLTQTGKDKYYPIELEVGTDPLGKPLFRDGIGVSLAHKGSFSVGVARAGSPVGIDLEVIQERGPGFEAEAFTPEELALVPSGGRPEWITRAWVAKEAYGKYLGKGLQGNPKRYVIEAIDDHVFRIGDVRIQTIEHQNHIIGWTL